MKKTMVLGLCIMLVVSFFMSGGVVRAEEVEQSETNVTVDKNSEVRAGDVITVTVSTTEDNTTGIYFNMDFERDAFEIVGVKGYDKIGNEVRIAGNKIYTPSNYSASFDKENNTSISKIQYKFTAPITDGYIQNVKVQLKAKKDITRDTVINVTEIAKTAIAAATNKGSGSVTIKALVIEPEPEPTPKPTPEPTPAPDKPTQTTKPELAKPAEKDDTPKTGLVDVALVASMVSAISLGGVVAVKKYSK